MPQGFKNSPAIFQRAMTLIFEGLIGKCCLIYIDDILVFGRTETEHENNLKLVMERIKKYGLVQNENKGQKKVKFVDFLGYRIGENTISPLTKRAEGIMNYKTPSTRKELQRFLGMINFDRIFIKGITELAMPLYKVLEMDKPFKWENQQEDAFCLIKQRWGDNLELIVPDFNELFVLETDASDNGIGGVLRQKHGPIAYVSRALKGAEKRYGITEKELLAAIWCMEKLEYFLIGREFLLVTDHEAIMYINSKKDFGSYRIQRWYDRLHRFVFKVEFRPGEENVQPDALSRAVIDNKETDSGEEELVKRILKIHEKYNHRKTIEDKIKEEKINISNAMLKTILDKCKICMCQDKKIGRNFKMIRVNRPGELIGADLLEISPRQRIIVLVDYFSRKVFARLINSKESGKIVEYISEVFKIYKFEEILCDNGKEFLNDKLKDWCETNAVKLRYSIPYYHPSNGRVERVNRTLRTALKKTKGPIKVELQRIIDNYNNTIHRATKMTPNEANKIENFKKVLESLEEYSKEFERKNKKLEKFEIGQEVIIRNECKRNKMDKEFNEKGSVVERLSNNAYSVRKGNGKVIVRHSTQLKGVYPGDVGTCGNVSDSVLDGIKTLDETVSLKVFK